MFDEQTCWIIYQARNWSNWSRPMRLAIQILPMVVYFVVGFRAWKHYEATTVKDGFYVTWRSLRWLIFLLIPWAVSQILALAYYTLCYSP